MDVFDQLLKEQKDLLQARGYNESCIHSADPEGKVFKRLENNLTHAIKYAAHYKEPYEFEIKTSGDFYDTKKSVLFTFEFEYDPDSNKLQIKSLLARSGDQEHKYFLQKNSDLPCSAEVFQKLIGRENKLERAKKMVQLKEQSKNQKL